MNFSKLISILCLTVISNVVSAQVIEENQISPDVEPLEVEALFGSNLETAEPLPKSLLLAIAIDHTTANSSYKDEQIGIPYIVDSGVEYWQRKLNEDEKSLAALVNNALYLLFKVDATNQTKSEAFTLLERAALEGYWPADFYIAEYNLKNYLTRPTPGIVVKEAMVIPGNLQSLANDTMARFNSCARLGFAPCQYRIGFWLSSSQRTLNDGLKALHIAAQTTMNDVRYQGVLDDVLLFAAKEIVLKGDAGGVKDEDRKYYAELIQKRLESYQANAEHG